MAATRLSDSQKAELVGRFREGSSSQQLAEAYGCSANTVIRLVRTELGEAEYERLKAQRSRRRSQPAAEASDPPSTLPPTPGIDTPEPPEPPAPALDSQRPRQAPPRRLSVPVQPAEEVVEEDGPAALAIDDADDFGDDDDDLLTTDSVDDDADDLADADGHPGGPNPFQPIPVVPIDDAASPGEGRLQPLVAATLPTSAYLLVDKTVELQARPLSEFPELGRLPESELERQALVVYLNPRQAKRQCGRTQRVIKVPDLKVLERTARFLVAQGISRVVIEGALYALPDS